MKIGINPDDLGSIEFGITALESRTDLAAKVATVGAAWSLIDVQLSMCLEGILSLDHRACAALMSRVPTFSAKIQMLREVARAILPEVQFNDLKACLSEAERLAPKRNMISHGL